MQSKHNRKFVPGSVDLIQGRVRNGINLMPQDEIEQILIESGILKDAPFLWVGMLYLYGTKLDLKAKFKSISKKYGDLDISVELDMKILQWADQNNLKLLKDIFMIAALEGLIQICKKYKLPDARFKEERLKYGTIPETVEECEQSYDTPDSLEARLRAKGKL